MPFTSKVKNKMLSGQSREIINNVLKFMKEEAESGTHKIHISKVHERVAAATGVSLRTVSRIKNEGNKVDRGKTKAFSSPNKKRENRHSAVALDDFDRATLRRTIIDFHITEKTVPSLKAIHRKFCDELGYQGSRESLRKAIHKLGFRWRKLKYNRMILMECQLIRNQRIQFLKRMHLYRQEGRPVIYMDKSYIHSSYTQAKGWNEDSNDGLKKSIFKGIRLFIVNAGGEAGFLPNSYIRWISNGSSGEYYSEMNFENYKKWVKQKLIPNLPQRSVVVINNTPYHNRQKEKMPTCTTRKDNMKQWLRLRNISFDDELLKPELYAIIKSYKPRYKCYETDDLFMAEGHIVLRLPPYHPELNPIEFVWKAMKEYVLKRNVSFNFENIASSCDEFFEQFTIEEWKSRCEHAKRFEIEFMEKEPIIDIIIDDFIYNYNENSDTDVESESSESDEESDSLADADDWRIQEFEHESSELLITIKEEKPFIDM